MLIAIVISTDSADVRLRKTCRSLVALGHRVHVIGWNRRPDLRMSDDIDGVYMHILSHRVKRRSWTISGQACFTRHVLKHLAVIKPHTVVAVNEDNIFRVLPLYGVSFKRLVCDLYDSHRDRASHRIFPVNIIASALCGFAHATADAIIATDETRRATLNVSPMRSFVIGNYPHDPGDSLSCNPVLGAPKIFVSGTLAKRRGLDVIIEALRRAPQVRVHAAGWFADDFSESVFAKHPQVNYLGHLTPSESLIEASKCDAVLALYAPDCRNNILASPNKVYDAMSVGRPLVINEEALISRWVLESGLGSIVPYYNVDSLAECLDQLSRHRGDLPRFAKHARSLFRAGFSWEATTHVFEKLYGPPAAA